MVKRLNTEQEQGIDLIGQTVTPIVGETIVPPGHRQVAQIAVRPWELAALLGLPEGHTVASVREHQTTFALVLLVEGPDLAPVPHDVEAPFLPGAFTRSSVELDGLQYTRLEWERTAVEDDA